MRMTQDRRRRASESGKLTMAALDKQLDETTTTVPIDEDETITGGDADERKMLLAEAQSFLAEIEKLGCGDNTELPDDKTIVSDEQKVLDECDEVEASIDKIEKDEFKAKSASVENKGIEDEIGDEANGGDQSVSNEVKNDVDTQTDKEVYGQNTSCSYVASITHRLDRVANILEGMGHKRMAFRIDRLSDALEAQASKKH